MFCLSHIQPVSEEQKWFEDGTLMLKPKYAVTCSQLVE